MFKNKMNRIQKCFEEKFQCNNVSKKINYLILKLNVITKKKVFLNLKKIYIYIDSGGLFKKI